MMLNTRVTAATWRADRGAEASKEKVGVTESTTILGDSFGGANRWLVRLRDSDGHERAASVDAIWIATGSRLDAASVPALRTARALSPRPEYDGLPELTPAMRWEERIPLYVAGGLGALQIGPDAFNLGGAGASAARIVSDVLQPRREAALWSPHT